MLHFRGWSRPRNFPDLRYVCLYTVRLATIIFLIITDTVRRPGCHSNAAIHPLWFRFDEGFSNAVRRPVRVQDLL